MRRLLAASLTVASLAVPFASAAQEKVLAKPPSPLLKEIVQGMPKGEKQEVRVIVATLEPGEATPSHTHRFPVTVYILAGTFTLEREGGAPVTLTTGQSMVEPPNVKLTGYNRGTDPMKAVIFYVSDPDTPFLDPTRD